MTSVPRQMSIPAVYMRGGTSKGVFFQPHHLPADPAARDAILLRVIGSPDAYEQQIDGMGGATSSTSKVVLVSRSTRSGCDVDYLFGQVAIGQPRVDWSGNCGNLTTAVGPFAISQGLVSVPHNGIATIRIWQVNIQKVIVAHVPVRDGVVVELGDFVLGGVTFPAAEVKLEFLDPGAGDEGEGGALFPTGRRVDVLAIPGVGNVDATLINAGNPTMFVSAPALGLTGTELQGDINGNLALLARCEAIRAHGAVAMGLADSVADATERRQHTPKLAYLSAPASYLSSGGTPVDAASIHLLARIFSRGKLHHAMTGTGAVALAAAAAIPGTVVSQLLGAPQNGITFGHPSGTLSVGAHAETRGEDWIVTRVTVSRTARRLMEGCVLVPARV